MRMKKLLDVLKHMTWAELALGLLNLLFVLVVLVLFYRFYTRW